MGKKKKKRKRIERSINYILQAIALTTALITAIAELIKALKQLPGREISPFFLILPQGGKTIQ